jgi:hypothetical protein
MLKNARRMLGRDFPHISRDQLQGLRYKSFTKDRFNLFRAPWGLSVSDYRKQRRKREENELKYAVLLGVDAP